MAKRVRAKKETEASVENKVVAKVEKKTNVPPKPKWKVLSGGISLLGGRSYSKGDVFEADEHEVPLAFRDIVEKIQAVEPAPVVHEPKFFINEIVASAEEQDEEGYVQMYNIVSEAGKVMNDEPLTKEEADELMKNL